MSKTLYYPVYIAPGRKTGGWSWGKPHDTIQEAAAWLEAEMEAIGSPLGTIVEFSGGEKVPLAGQVRPKDARQIVRRWELLMDCTDTDTEE